MKFHKFSSTLVLLSLAASSALANPLLTNESSLNRRAVSGSSSETTDIDASPKAVARGTLDAPVDGKDGKPHAGPWVETNADRDRKKAKQIDGTVQSTKLDSHTVNRLGSEAASMPDTNDGVMDDPHRLGPKDGTRGTEGGVSEKSKGAKSVTEKVPETPKEAPPLPHSEQEKMPSTHDSAVDSTSKDKLLEKPADLPSKPHDIPPPKSPAPVSDDPLNLKSGTSKSDSDKSTSGSKKETTSEGKVISPVHSLFLSLTMILFSEVGDKTFLVAALMAMRHPRLLVFSAAFSALFIMTVLSAILGHAVPALIPATFTKFLAAALFLVFGLKMLKEGRAMSPDEGVSEEMKEVEMELEEKEQEQLRMSGRDSAISPYALEAGRAGRAGRKTRSSGNRLPSPPESVSSSSSREPSPSRGTTWQSLFVGFNNLCSLLLSPAWVQTFIMTFLGEWGDRSQIATIAMAAGQDYWWVMMGAVIGHAICTAAAVIGGRAIAGRVSLRAVTLGGATAFLIFALIYFIEVFA